MRKGFYVKVVLVVFFWFVWALTADQISKIKPLKSFDPFQILGIEPGAEMKDIKKAYRRLSLIKHPDKNPDDPLAVTEFIQITKAYTVSLKYHSNYLARLWQMKLQNQIGKSMEILTAQAVFRLLLHFLVSF